MDTRIHPTALIETDVQLGPGCQVWDNVHIRRGARIGAQTTIGEKTYIAYDVRIGARVKINAFVYLCHGVTLEDGVMVSAGTVFTNDRYPRAATPDLRQLRPAGPDDETLHTLVRAGCTIGARCTIGPGLTLGRFAMIGMGAVVTREVPDFCLALGNPARVAGFVCRCGQPLGRLADFPLGHVHHARCPRCARRYTIEGTRVVERRAHRAEVA